MTDVIEVSRQLASIQRIVSLNPIPNADKIEVATILGWHVVVKKEEFKVGDLCVYFEVDSILPKRPWSEFLIDKNRPDKPIRLKTVRLRGQVSQGLAIPVTTVFKDFDPYSLELPIEVYGEIPAGIDIVRTFDIGALKEGDDVTEMLGIKKYEPPIPAELAGKVRGNFPSFLIKTDTHRIQAHPAAIDELIACGEVYVTIKVDGTSATYYNRIEPTVEIGQERFGVCSRNMDLMESDTNTYWRMAKKYDLPAKLKGLDLSIQGEVHGMGIQANKLGLPDVQLAVFDAFNIRTYRYYDLDALIYFCDNMQLKMVPLLYRGPMIWNSVDALIEYAESINYPNHTKDHESPAEGIIVRPVVERYSESLKGRLAVKAISPRFLLYYKQ